mgnify:CR=1 FL=1
MSNCCSKECSVPKDAVDVANNDTELKGTQTLFRIENMDCPTEEGLICLLYTSPSPRD